MKKFQGIVNVGIREKDTNRLIAVYPKPLQGDDNYIQDKVFFWYYQQSCSAEDELKHYFVDNLSEKEQINAGLTEGDI